MQFLNVNDVIVLLLFWSLYGLKLEGNVVMFSNILFILKNGGLRDWVSGVRLVTSAFTRMYTVRFSVAFVYTKYIPWLLISLSPSIFFQGVRDQRGWWHCLHLWHEDRFSWLHTKVKEPSMYVNIVYFSNQNIQYGLSCLLQNLESIVNS